MKREFLSHRLKEPKGFFFIKNFIPDSLIIIQSQLVGGIAMTRKVKYARLFME
jgi:hypothetical protein